MELDWIGNFGLNTFPVDIANRRIGLGAVKPKKYVGGEIHRNKMGANPMGFRIIEDSVVLILGKISGMGFKTPGTRVKVEL